MKGLIFVTSLAEINADGKPVLVAQIFGDFMKHVRFEK